MASPMKVPPSIAKASREELEKILIATLQKLKARDKRIDELSKGLASPPTEKGSNGEENEGNRPTTAKEMQLETTVATLQAKLMSSEQAFNDRMAAETELFTSQLADARQNAEKYAAMLRDARESSAALQEQLAQREAIMGKMQEAIDHAQQIIENQNAEKLKLQAQAAALPSVECPPTDSVLNDVVRQKIVEMRVEPFVGSLENISLEGILQRLRDLDSERREASARATTSSHQITELQCRVGRLQEELQTRTADSKNTESALEAVKEEQRKERAQAADLTQVSNSKGPVAVPKGESTSLPCAKCQQLEDELQAAKRLAAEDMSTLQRDVEDLRAQLSAAETKLMSQEGQLATGSTPPKEHEALVRDAESARAEVAQIRKEVDAERARFKKALAESKRRIETLQRDNQAKSIALSEARQSAEKAAVEVAGAEQRIVAALRDKEASAVELQEYKARAHALLKAKENQIREARTLALEEQSSALDAAESAAQAALAEAARIRDQLRNLEQRAMTEAVRAKSEHEAVVAELQKEASAAREAAEASARQHEQLKLRYESLEMRLQHMQSQLSAATTQASQVDALRYQLDSSIQERDALRESLSVAVRARDADLTAARETCESLKEERTALQEVISRLRAAADVQSLSYVSSQPSGALASQSSLPLTNSVIGNEPMGISSQDKEIDRESSFVALYQRRASELEREVEELEREVELRGVQEAALKEAVRDLERELERVKLPGKAVDMEYFKNVMLKLFETGEEESLLPVVAAVLQFSPAEVVRCRSALESRTAQRAALLAAGNGSEPMTSYFTSLLGFGGSSVAGGTVSGSVQPIDR